MSVPVPKGRRKTHILSRPLALIYDEELVKAGWELFPHKLQFSQYFRALLSHSRVLVLELFSPLS